MRCWQWVMTHSIRTGIPLSVSSCHVNVWKNPELLTRQSGSSLHPALWVKGSCSRAGWRLCSPWYPLDDRCGSRAASADPSTRWYPRQSVLLGMVMEKRGVKTLYTFFQAFSCGMLKFIPGIIEMFQVTPKKCHLSLMLSPVQMEMSGKHLGDSRSSFVIWSLISAWDFCPALVEISNGHKWTCRIPPLIVTLKYCNHSCLDFLVCIARKLFLVRLGLCWGLTCQSQWNCWVWWQGSFLGGSTSINPGYPSLPINSVLWYLLQYSLDCFFHVKSSKTNRLKYTIAYGAVIFRF